MNAQDIFNKAYLGILKQGTPGAHHGGGGCDYFTPEGNMCGIGHVAGPELAKHWSSEEIGSVDMIPYDEVPEWLRDNFDLAVSIQAAHDEAESHVVDDDIFIAEFKERMADVAAMYKLEVPAT